VTLRLVFDDAAHPDFDLDLWLAEDALHRDARAPSVAIQEARGWLARAEAILRRPASPLAAVQPPKATTAREPRPERLFAAASFGAFGVALAWLSLTPWMAFAGVAVAVITLATALTSAVPGWLDAIRPLSPLSPAYDAVRAAISGGPGITAGVFTLIAWTLLGALFSVAAILRARTVSPAALATVS